MPDELLTGKEADPGPRGCVEAFHGMTAWGWVFAGESESPRIQVRCGGALVEVNAAWVQRPELEAALGAMRPLRGFQFRVPYDVAARLVRNPALAEETFVLVNGGPLPFADGVQVTPIPSGQWVNLPSECVLTIADALRPVQMWSESPFRICCRVEKMALAAQDLRLICNGEPIDAVVIVLPETAAPAEGSATSPPTASICEFILPGWIWESEAATPGFRLQFEIAGHRVPGIPLEIGPAEAQEWLERQESAGPHDTFDQVLALEHAHFLDARIPVSEAVMAYFSRAANEYGLNNYLRLGERASSADAQADDDANASAPHWRALRDFSHRLPEYAGREHRLLEHIDAAWPENADKSAFFECVVPLFCRLGHFDAVRHRLSAQHIERLASSQNAWTASLALPFLVANGQTDRATELLYALQNMPGWVNTECIAYASRQMAEGARRDANHERFAYALIGLLDRIGWDYYSRLHDVQYIEALACWLDEALYLNNWLRDDVQSAALRLYGFSPVFWARVQPCLLNSGTLCAALVAAQPAYQRLRVLLASAPAAALPPSASTDLAFFRRLGSLEVPQILRELICAQLQESVDVGTTTDEFPLQEVLALGVNEGVRFAALPLADDESVLARLPTLSNSLAAMQENIGHSPRHELQLHLGKVQRHLWEIARTRNPEAAEQAIPPLLQDVLPLAESASRHLAADVLARALVTLLPLGGAKMLGSELAKQIIHGLTTGGEQRWPDQPVISAYSVFRSGAHLGGDPVLLSHMRQLDQQLEKRCGIDHAHVLKATSSPERLLLRSQPGKDTLVVIYSCRKYLDTRVKAIRETWLKDLDALGMPHLVLVGDGEDVLNGDVLALNVSDRYEDLPAKTLAMVRWVVENTDFQYLVKIDDDCLLNVDAYFDSLSYRKFHYYGRILRRDKGGTDRRWHQGKSQSSLAKRAIDKSPEPSIYADGGGGYSLSRLAMTQILHHAGSPWGQRLCATSFLEDKLIGDLLSWSTIAVHNEDYCTLVRRRFGDNAQPVCVFDNVFAPSRSSPTKLAHLDTAADMAPVRERMGKPGLWPRKIWPTYMAPSLHSDQNQLELLTDESAARALLREDFFVVAVMRNEKVMLPHFLAHYRKMGCRAFIVVDNLSDDGTRETLLAQPDVVLYSADTQYGKSTFGVAWQQAVLANHCLGKWALVADADELLVFPGCEQRPFAEVLAELEAGGHDAARVVMVDMYPFGDLDEADFTHANSPFDAAAWFDRESVVEWRLTNGAYSNASTFVSGLRHRLLPSAEPHAFTSQKYCLIRYAPWMRLCAGLHNIANANVAPASFWFAHFKYHAGFKTKVEEEVSRKQHFGNAAEYKKYLGLLAEGRGQFGLEGVSVRYTGSACFVDLLGGKSAP